MADCETNRFEALTEEQQHDLLRELFRRRSEVLSRKRLERGRSLMPAVLMVSKLTAATISHASGLALAIYKEFSSLIATTDERHF